jgi:NRAMP (natural resistance-associated macrophage protein)-like metal ion transporter
MVMKRIKNYFRDLGPGLVTGAADNDPSGIATYTQTGAQFGYGQLWTAIFMLHLLIAIQEACARIGAVNEAGLAAVIKEHYSKKVLYCAVLLVLIANTINIGADIGAMAASLQLLVPINTVVLIILFTVVMVLCEVFIGYKKYANILKWLALSMLSYPLTVFIVHEDWGTLFTATFLPHIEWNFQFLFIITGVLGTTISPYLFFWQGSQQVEDVNQTQKNKSTSKKEISSHYMKKLRLDNFTGMLSSEIVTWSIIVVAATVLHKHGVTTIKSPADAAKALEPFVNTFSNSGFIAELIFVIGIVGLGLLAVPVLAGSTAYALGETFGWKVGLDYKFKEARGFYGIIIATSVVGSLLNVTGINPIKALVYCAVINGVVAVPLIFLIAITARSEKIMGKHKSGIWSQLFVGLTFVGMGLAAVTMFFTAGKT